MDFTKEIYDLIDLFLSGLGGLTLGSLITIKYYSKKNTQKSGKNSKQQIGGNNSNQAQNN